MLDDDTLQLLMLVMAALAAGAVVYALLFPYISGDKQVEKRMQNVTENKSRRTARRVQQEQTASRRKAVADTLKDLEDRQKKRERISLRLRLQRAGLDMTPRAFWIASAITGVATAIAILVGIPNAHPIVIAASGFIGAFGLPRWALGYMIKRRQAKFIAEFANAIDVIVRGVKSGLPLNECLGIIARESPSPIREEFAELVEQQRVGMPITECFERMIARLPLAEVKFFGIVIAIQQQAGGNLSEALGNLSGVLRDRKQLQAKVAALSAEAKASAYVLGSLPFLVMTMVYVTTPNYISLLWTTKVGVFALCCAAMWMSCGVFVMWKMINFKF